MFKKKLKDVFNDFSRKLNASSALLSEKFSLKMKEEIRIHKREVHDEIIEVRDEYKSELKHRKHTAHSPVSSVQCGLNFFNMYESVSIKFVQHAVKKAFIEIRVQIAAQL